MPIDDVTAQANNAADVIPAADNDAHEPQEEEVPTFEELVDRYNNCMQDYHSINGDVADVYPNGGLVEENREEELVVVPEPNPGVIPGGLFGPGRQGREPVADSDNELYDGDLEKPDAQSSWV